jgi:hypothetical protein
MISCDGCARKSTRCHKTTRGKKRKKKEKKKKKKKERKKQGKKGIKEKKKKGGKEKKKGNQPDREKKGALFFFFPSTGRMEISLFFSLPLGASVHSSPADSSVRTPCCLFIFLFLFSFFHPRSIETSPCSPDNADY